MDDKHVSGRVGRFVVRRAATKPSHLAGVSTSGRAALARRLGRLGRSQRCSARLAGGMRVQRRCVAAAWMHPAGRHEDRGRTAATLRDDYLTSGAAVSLRSSWRPGGRLELLRDSGGFG